MILGAPLWLASPGSKVNFLSRPNACYTEKMSIPRLPLPQVLDAYKITPETLWVDFLLFAPWGTNNPERKVEHGFSLSYPGRAGVDAILAREKSPDFLGCFSLSGLEVLLKDVLTCANKASLSFVDSAASFLRIKKDFLVVARDGAGERVEFVRAFTLDRAISVVREKFPDATIGFGGELSDLVSLVEDMRQICLTQDFKRLHEDYRSPISGWRAPELLLAARNSSLRAGMERFTEELSE